MRSSASLAAFVLLLGFAHARAETYDATGTASWYGDELAGRRTAYGTAYNPDAITIAHRTLPLGSFVTLTAVDTGRTIVAMVGDRGPFHGDRLVDLSRGAARQLGLSARPQSRVRVRAAAVSAGEASALRSGRAAPVRVAGEQRVDMPVPVSPTGRYGLRVGTFSSQARAAALAQVLGAELAPVDGLWRVMLGPYQGADAAQRARDAVVARGYGDAVLLPQP